MAARPVVMARPAVRAARCVVVRADIGKDIQRSAEDAKDAVVRFLASHILPLPPVLMLLRRELLST